MSNRLEILAWRAAQNLRVSWYSGQKMIAARLSEGAPAPDALKARMPTRARLLADLRRLLERDLANIEAGYYAVPEADGAAPWALLRRAAAFFADLRAVEARRRAGAVADVPAEDGNGRYPDYYLQNFHHQTDGYLSPHSAALYDHQVEVLFGGGADAMRRQALVPLWHELQRRRIRTAALADLGCGTGRFLRAVKSNYPRLRVTGFDLSPAYLAEARTALAPWSGVQLVEAAAEALPAPAESYDVVTSVYLLHELPAATRQEVAAEIARVLKPGGLAIIVDSVQLGDEPDYDALLEYFPLAMHEPYYDDYIRRGLGDVFGAAGLRPELADRAYFSKIATFRKPLRP